MSTQSNKPSSNWLVFLFSIVVSTIVLEVGLRCSCLYCNYSEKNVVCWKRFNHPIRTRPPSSWYHTHKPNSTVQYEKQEFEYRYRPNSFGLNNKTSTFTTKKDSCLRILTLGDSYTEGVGSHPDSSWPAFLQTKLTSRLLSTEVYNAGVSGSDPWFEYVLLRDKLVGLNPDIVVVAVNVSDVKDLMSRGGMSRFLPNGTVKFKSLPWWSIIYQHVHFVRPIIHLSDYDKLLFSRGERSQMSSEFIKHFIPLVEMFQLLGAEKSFVPVFVFFPTGSDLKYDLSGTSFDDAVIDSCHHKLKEMNVLSLSLKTEMEAAIGKDTNYEYSWRIDSHYNSKGYQLMGELIANRIVPLLEADTVVAIR